MYINYKNIHIQSIWKVYLTDIMLTSVLPNT